MLGFLTAPPLDDVTSGLSTLSVNDTSLQRNMEQAARVMDQGVLDTMKQQCEETGAVIVIGIHPCCQTSFCTVTPLSVRPTCTNQSCCLSPRTAAFMSSRAMYPFLTTLLYVPSSTLLLPEWCDRPRDRKERLTCAVCTDTHPSMAFVPCGHVVVCTACSAFVSQCPTCRGDVCERFHVRFRNKDGARIMTPVGVTSRLAKPLTQTFRDYCEHPNAVLESELKHAVTNNSTIMEGYCRVHETSETWQHYGGRNPTEKSCGHGDGSCALDPTSFRRLYPTTSAVEYTEPGATLDFDLDCMVCGKLHRANTTLRPCGHVCACEDCAQRLEQCPECQTPVVETFKLYGLV